MIRDRPQDFATMLVAAVGFVMAVVAVVIREWLMVLTGLALMTLAWVVWG